MGAQHGADDAETHTGAALLAAGGEERLKNAVAIYLGNTAAVVADKNDGCSVASRYVEFQQGGAVLKSVFGKGTQRTSPNQLTGLPRFVSGSLKNARTPHRNLGARLAL